MSNVIDFDAAKQARILKERAIGLVRSGEIGDAQACIGELASLIAEFGEERVAERARAVAEARRLLDEGRVDEAIVQLSALKCSAASRLAPLGASDIFAPLGAIPWLCEGLEMCPGPPSLWAGYGYSGKTMAAQVLALCVAAGLDFSNLAVKRGKVMHLDWEQGSRETRARYQKLARGLGIWSNDVDGNLSFVPLPQIDLAGDAAEGALKRLCEGHALCIIDSFRAACPSIDENSSEARKPLDMLNRVSEATGCCFVVIHHARKPSGDGGKEGGARMAIRGSGAFYDASASVFIFAGEKGQPTRIYHEKARVSGKLRDDMLMSMRDDEGALIVEIGTAPAVAVTGSALDRLGPKILEFVRNNPGCGTHALRAQLGAKVNHVNDCVRAMIDSGQLEDWGSGSDRAPRRLHVPQSGEGQSQ